MWKAGRSLIPADSYPRVVIILEGGYKEYSHQEVELALSHCGSSRVMRRRNGSHQRIVLLLSHRGSGSCDWEGAVVIRE
jgi:hypothetical protein